MYTIVCVYIYIYTHIYIYIFPAEISSALDRRARGCRSRTFVCEQVTRNKQYRLSSDVEIQR